jgi:hypothetical protein
MRSLAPARHAVSPRRLELAESLRHALLFAAVMLAAAAFVGFLGASSALWQG